MYEPATETPNFRRLFGVVLWLVAVVVVVWFLVWLIFFHHPHAKVSTTKTTQGQHGQQTPSSTGSGTPNSPATNTNKTPTQLANTGAGNVLIPFSVAFIMGSGLYYIRLRKKLTI